MASNFTGGQVNEDSELDRLFEHLTLVHHTRQALAVEFYGLTERLVRKSRYYKPGRFGSPLTFSHCFEYQYPSKKRGREELYFSKGTVIDDSIDIRFSQANDRLHRIHGPAYINHLHHVEIWIRNGVIDREDGPAIIHKENRLWVKNGYFHRLDGPAIDTKHCNKQYWINGQELSPKDFKKEIKRRIKKGQYSEKRSKEI